MINHELISERARHRWQFAGCPSGRDLDFWLRAEAELTFPKDFFALVFLHIGHNPKSVVRSPILVPAYVCVDCQIEWFASGSGIYDCTWFKHPS
jgi:hypothetical protein